MLTLFLPCTVLKRVEEGYSTGVAAVTSVIMTVTFLGYTDG